ncbi:MAG: nuclear transport factor 2 family protein [Egibacteraceae bacterium]
MAEVTAELTEAAWAAFGSGDRSEIEKYWAEDLRWLVPGRNPLSGWKESLDEFLDFSRQTAELSANSFNMQTIATMASDEYSANITYNSGSRPDGRRLSIDVVHAFRWRDGKIVEAKGAIFGDGAAQFDEFWA